MTRTGATKITAIGIRVGGTVLAATHADTEWAHLILWDAITDGDAFVSASVSTEMNRRKRAMPRWGRRMPRSRAGVQEILGFTWSLAALDELRQLRIDESALRVRASWFSSAEQWADEKLLELMPDTFIVQSLTSLVEKGA